MDRIFRLRFLFLIIPFFFSYSLFGRGKQEVEKKEPQNTGFVLCIAAFDISALPSSHQTLGPILQRELARELEQIRYRVRSEEEQTRYEELAKFASMHAAAAQIAEKRAERDNLLYSGTPGWKYKKELKRITGELRKLEENYRKAETEQPLIAEKPFFKLSQINADGTFPPPPEQGGEEQFLRSNNADALLAGRLRTAYGRIFAEFRIFTRGGSFVYEDSTLFSAEDLQAASDELKLRFLAALTNAEPRRLTVNAEPDTARILVNGRFAESGETVQLPPGPVKVEVSADDHQSAVREIEDGNEEEELFVVLKAFTLETLGITLPGPGSSVYMGSLYRGGRPPEQAEEAAVEEDAETVTVTAIDEESTDERPAGFFSVYIPMGQYRYIRVDTEDGLTGEAIVKGGPQDEMRIVTLEPRKLPGKNDKPVDEKRRKFYGAFGRFWIALPLAFFINGVSQSYINDSGRSREMYDRALTSYRVSIGAWSVAGIFLAESLIRMGIYIHSASKESIPLWE